MGKKTTSWYQLYRRTEGAMGSPPFKTGEPSPPGFTHTVPCLPDLGLQPCLTCLNPTPNHDVMPEVMLSICVRMRASLSQWECHAMLANLKGGALLRRESSFSPKQYIPPEPGPGPQSDGQLAERWFQMAEVMFIVYVP